MESGNGGDSSKGVLEPVLEASDAFLNVLTPLKRAYLYQESSLSFEYKSAFLVKNLALEEKYDAFRARQRAAGYSEEDLEETFGFLLFEDFNKATSLGETGVVTGNSTCTTLGDPSKGVYISMYSDCLDLNRWYHGKSGYIAILKLTKGRVKKVLENYTETFTVPTAGFDCHVSEQLPSVSDKTSSFLAFERTQYYIYELLKPGSNETLQSPSAAYPFAIVSFSYTDTKVAPVAPQQKREEKKLVSHYVLWRGQLQIGDLFYNVSLRSSLGALIPAALPSVVKVERVISMLDLRQVVPPSVFETSSGEVLLDGLCCSLCEFVSSDEDGASSLSQLLCEVKEKNVALPISLSDGGFLVLVHSSHFLTFDGTGSAEVFQAVFVFPDSRVIQRDTKCGPKKPAISTDILRVLPVLNYAEGEVEKTLIDPSEDLSEVLAQHMQSYAALINPGLGSSPSREVSIFADQYDVPDDHKHLYASSEWTPRAWQSLQSYLNRPASFQLPVAKTLEILETGQENRIEDLNDDVYICLSSPEEAPVNTEDCLSEDQCKNNEAFVDSAMTEAETPMDLSRPHTDVSDDLQVEGSDKIPDKSEPSALIETDLTRTNNLLIPSTSDELPAELIVSITSAERTNQGVMSTELPKKPDFSTAKSQTDGIITANDAAAGTKKLLDSPVVKDSTKTKRRKGQRSHYTSRKKVCNASPVMQTPPMEHTSPTSHETDLPKELEENQQSGIPPITVRGKKQKRLLRQWTPSNKTVTSSTVGPAVTEETRTNTEQQALGRTILKEFESFPLRKKTERWDLKPVLSECGSVLVPHGSLDIAGIKSLQDKLQLTKTEKDEKPEAIQSEVPSDTPEMEQTSATAPETTTVQDRGDDLNNVAVSPVSPKHNIMSPDGDPSCENLKSNELLLRTEVTDTVPSEDVQENPSDNLPPAKSSSKGDYFLSKLKSVLLRGKRKMGPLESEEMTEGTAQSAEPSIKVNKVDTDMDVLKDGDTNFGFKDVPKILSVDHHFAYALGLTPREIPRRVPRTDDLCTQQREDSSQGHEQTKFDKHKILQRPPLIFPRRGRIKTLKKHQDVSAENIKKKCTPQVSYVSGSAGQLHHQKTMCDDGSRTQHPSVDQTDRTEQVCWIPDISKKLPTRRKKFRHSRTFVNKDGSIQVTKKWKGNYDFSLDSRFSSDSKDKTIVRALHGPWDCSVQDISEEMRLIVHMWIGLFYSRSTARFFHLDPDLAYPHLEESDPLEMSGAIVPGSECLKQKVSSDVLCQSGADTSELSASKALDLSKKDNSALEKEMAVDQGSLVLDLSLKNTNTEVASTDLQVNKEDTGVSCPKQKEARKKMTAKSHKRQKEASSSKVNRETVPYTKTMIQGNGIRSLQDNNRTCIPLPTACLLGPNNVLLVPLIPVHNRTAIDSENSLIAPGFFDMLQGHNNEKNDVKDSTGNPVPVEVGLLDSHRRVSSKSMMDPANKEAGSAVPTEKLNTSESKDEERLELKEKLHQEDSKVPCPKLIQLDRKDSGIAHNGSQLLSRGPMAVSQGKTLNVPEDVPCTSNENKLPEEEPSGTQDRHVEKDASVIDESSQPVSMMCNGPSSGKDFHLDDQPPQESLHDLQSTKQCAIHRDDHAKTYKDSNSLTRMESMEGQESAAKEVTKVDACWPEKMIKTESTCSSDMSIDDIPVPQTSDRKETRCKDKQMVPSSLKSDDHKDQDILQVEREQIVKKPVPQTSDGVETACKDKQMISSSLSFHEHEDQDTILVEKQEMVDIPVLQTLDREQTRCKDKQMIPSSLKSEGNKDQDTMPVEKEEMIDIPVLQTLDRKETRCKDKQMIPSSLKSEGNTDQDTLPVERVQIADIPVPQTSNGEETICKDKQMRSSSPKSDDHKDQDTIPVERVQTGDSMAQEEPSLFQPHLSQFEQSKTQAEMAPKLPDFESAEGLEEYSSRVVIPFLGEDIPSENADLLDVSESQGKPEGSVQGQKERASTSETANLEVCSTSSVNVKKKEQSSGTVSFLNISENNQLLASGRESDDRCPTPTMDEKPYETPSCLGPSTVTPTKKTEKCLSRSSLTENNFKQKPCQKSAVNGSSYSLNVLQPDVELRTLRVFQSIGKFLSKSTENSSQIETTDMKQPPQQTPSTKSKNSPSCPPQSHHSKNSKVQKVSKKKPVPVAQEQQTGPSENSKISLFKGRIEEVLGVRLQSEKTELLNHQQYYEGTDTSQESSQSHTLQFLPSSECLGPTKANIDQDRTKATSQSYSSHEQRSSSQRPVMAVKPSKSDESQGDCLSRERLMEYSYPKNQQPKSPTMKPMEKKMGYFKGNSEGWKKELSSRRSWPPHKSDRKPELYKASFARRDPVHYEPKESSRYCKRSSSLSGKHGFLGGTSAEKVGPTAEGSLEVHQKDCLDPSVSRDGMDDDLYLGPDCSLSCTVYNTDKMRSHSFLEQMSNRCVQDDPTMASMENECLIFSEKMKQLMKRCKTECTHQPNPQDKLNQSGSSPLTIDFARLEGPEESVRNLDVMSILGQKIKVDTSDREELAAATEKSSQQTGTSIEHAGVSRITAECVEQYEETMNNICAVRNVPSKLSQLRLDRGYSKSEPSKYFDFCDQMKKEMDESFRSNLNSIVKKSCKTKYRFYILETSDDAFFEETKAHLEAEGHTAVQPSEFFLDESTSSSLLIIIRNEDIAENVCEVPHLLELKKSPDVHFAGIDEPDDVVNLTHQELFAKGGFIMIDRAVLEPLSLCHMKKMSEILQELSRTGKWKWMLHYRDSRRIKENARLSPEAKEKKNFLNGCQESGIVDVLPYHECDLMSRDQPDYLTCLVRLQVQNILARYTVFITDSTTDSRFESNGIVTMTFDSFLSCSLTEAFTI